MKTGKLISYRSLFFLLPFVYFFVYGRYGLDNVDGGYAIALFHRILHGEAPYKDFVFVRPPLFLYLHSLPLLIIPVTFHLIANRLIAYLTFTFTAWVSTEIISRHFNLDEYKLDKYLLSCIIFIFSAHNFPPMAWYTTDGILLGTIGIYFLSIRPTNFRISFGMLFLIASAMIKQSFYPMPVAGILYLFFTQSTRHLIAGIISFVTICLLIYFAAAWSRLLEPFLQLTGGTTRMSDAIDAGIWSYINTRIFKIPFACCVLFILLKFGMKYLLKTKIENGWLIMAYVFTVFVSIIWRSRMNEAIHFQRLYPQIFFMAATAGILVELFKNKKRNELFVLLCMLSLAWCSSLSWGYQTPLLFAAPLIFGIIWVSKEIFNFRHIRLLYYLLFFGGLVSFWFANGNAYYDSKRKDLVYDMDKVFPRLAFIKSDKQTFTEYTELKNLADQYGNNFKTLPGVPLANFLTNTIPPIGVDWALDIEVNFHTDVIIDQLNKSNCYVFVERNALLKDPKWRSSATDYVVTNWNKIEEREYFSVYKAPETK